MTTAANHDIANPITFYLSCCWSDNFSDNALPKLTFPLSLLELSDHRGVVAIIACSDTLSRVCCSLVNGQSGRKGNKCLRFQAADNARSKIGLQLLANSCSFLFNDSINSGIFSWPDSSIGNVGKDGCRAGSPMTRAGIFAVDVVTCRRCRGRVGGG